MAAEDMETGGVAEQVNEEWAKDKEQQAKRLEGIQQQLKASRAASAPGIPPQWYVNGQGQTMVVIPGPVEFVMGSPTTEVGRVPNENQHQRRIGRTFALAAKSVTLAEYQRFDPAYGTETKQWSPTGDCPVLGISWFQAAEYCNWLSKQEGLPESEWCYLPLRGPKTEEFKVGMELAANHLKTQRLSSAYGNGGGICDTPGVGDIPILWGDGRAIAEVCVVQQERAGPGLAGWEKEAE